MNMTGALTCEWTEKRHFRFQDRIARQCEKKGDDMGVRKRVFLESDEYGREYFDETEPGSLLGQVQQLIESCNAECARDQVVRRLGVEIRPDSEARSA
jgi:hypothetical protein